MPHVFLSHNYFKANIIVSNGAWHNINQIPFQYANAHISTKPFLPLHTAVEETNNQGY